jgi:Mu-like prophage major head subunit gpT
VREFRETLEIIRSEEASIGRLFGGDGTPARAAKQTADYQRKLVEAATFMAQVWEGKRPIYHLQEALTTGDFPLLFADIIDREMLADYVATTKSWPLWAKTGSVPDFRNVNRFAIDGSEAVLAAVPQGDQYPESNLSDTRYTYAVGKYGRRIAFAWESMVNDDLDGLKSIPLRMARGATRAEEKFATGLIADANGPHATMFSVGNKNQIVLANGSLAANPTLSITGLQNAMTVLAKQVDKDGEPIAIGAVVLVVPPALRVTAENILNSTELWISDAQGGGAAGQQVHAQNWMKGMTRLAVDYYLPVISTTNGGTSWYLFANPDEGRPAVEIGFLRGHENPETFVKLADSQLLGGGVTDPSEGDFDTDSIQYKIRHVFGGTRLDPKMAVASNGTGV